MVNELMTRLVKEQDSPFKPASKEDLDARGYVDPEEKKRREIALRHRLQAERDEKIERVLNLLGLEITRRPAAAGTESWRGTDLWTARAEDGSGLFIRVTGHTDILHHLVYDGGGHSLGTINVSGTMPKGRDGRHIKVRDARYNDVEAPEINVSLSKTPEKIVQDIEKRFMPKHKEYVAKAIKQRDEEYAHEDLTQKNLAFLKGAELSDYEKSEEKLRLSGDNMFYGDVEVSGNSISMKLRGLTVEQAKQILKIANEEIVDAEGHDG